MSIFTPSSEQEDIYRAMLESNLIVSACPGSGKSTTIFHAFPRIPILETSFLPPRILYLVFNKRNQIEAVEKCKTLNIKNVEISTFHSLSMRTLKGSGLVSPKDMNRRDFVSARKVPKLVWNALDRDNPDTQNVIKLVSLMKGVVTLDGTAGVRKLVQHYELDFADESGSIQCAERVLRQSDSDLSCIDFDDMLRLPVVLNVKFQPWDWVFTDECQDTNEVQSEILWRLQKPTTRSVFVGDPHQAIYGFRGAQSDAMTKLRDRFGCRTLPLSVSYRCPKAVVREAQKYV